MRSYVVRVQDPRSASPRAEQLCGVVEAVATGERMPFRSAEELVRALRSAGDVGDAGWSPAATDLDHATSQPYADSEGDRR